jgi:adenosylcobyric acid synthase
MPAKALMIQGTSSSVGKSVLAAALCRIFARRGVRVAPFKAQNMSNNAAVCGDGSEIGRAQAVQAAAAGIEPTADMNPVLLKPEADARSQVIVLGRPWGMLASGSYGRRKEALWPVVTAALDRLRAQGDLVIMEGAGSPVELNLRDSDIANMAIARYAQAPVLLVGDIDRGGIFAQMLGTLWLLEPEDRALVRGLIVNRFRGDRSLFADGIRILEERSTAPVLGVIPYLPALNVPEEDAVALDVGANGREGMPPRRSIDVAIIQLPHIANFDDFDPLALEPGVLVRYVQSAEALGRPDAVILPGTKSTIADLAWLREQGLAEAIRKLAHEGAAIVGICGGYQMLGRRIADPLGVESDRREAIGMGLLPVETTFDNAKATYQAIATVLESPGWLRVLAGQTLGGYEIHMGGTGGGTPWLAITRRNGVDTRLADGAISDDGRLWGCYLHGLFANAEFRRAWLSSLRDNGSGDHALRVRAQGMPPGATLDAALNRLADAVEAAIDMQRLEAILQAMNSMG